MCMKKIADTRPEIFGRNLNDITAAECKDWAGKLNGKLADHCFNNTIGTLRLIFDAGIALHKDNGGTPFENPAEGLQRVKVRQRT